MSKESILSTIVSHRFSADSGQLAAGRRIRVRIRIRQGEDDIKAFVDVSLKLMFESGYLQDSLRKWWGGGVLDEYFRRIEKVFQE